MIYTQVFTLEQTGIVCDGCGAEVAGGKVEGELRHLQKRAVVKKAKEAGWGRWQEWNGLAYVYRDYCKGCSEGRELPDEYVRLY